ncbi:MAG: peptidoglycan DD-metalloendopeptidase family protein [Candidatus Pacearchaeota archaeon]
MSWTKFLRHLFMVPTVALGLISHQAHAPGNELMKDFNPRQDKELVDDSSIYSSEDKSTYSEPIEGLNIPVKAGQISSDYGTRTIDGERDMHYGIDIGEPLGELGNASISDRVFSPAKGVVKETGYGISSGKYIKISHPVDSGSLESIICHLSEYDVQEGDTLSSFEFIGKKGNTGHSTDEHIHMGVKENGNYRDPSKFLKDNYNEVGLDAIVGNYRKSFKESYPHYYSKLKASHPDLLYPESEQQDNSVNNGFKKDLDLTKYLASGSGLYEDNLSPLSKKESEKSVSTSGKNDLDYLALLSRVQAPDSGKYRFNNAKSIDSSQQDTNEIRGNYRIQIAASKNPLPGQKIREFEKKYGGEVKQDVASVKGDTYYKYSIGNFQEIRDAVDFKRSLGSKKNQFAVLCYNRNGRIKDTKWHAS